MVRNMRSELVVTRAWSLTVIRANRTEKETVESIMGRVRVKWWRHQTLSGLRFQSEAPGDLLINMETTEVMGRAHGLKYT